MATMRWKRLDLDAMDGVTVEVDEAIERYRQALTSEGVDGDGTKRLKRSMEVRIMQLDRFAKQNESDSRASLVEVLKMRLQKLVESDGADFKGPTYERITTTSYASPDKAAGSGAAASAPASEPFAPYVRPSAASASVMEPATPTSSVAGTSRTTATRSVAPPAEYDATLSPQQRRLLSQQEELQAQQVELEAQRRQLVRDQADRDARVAAHDSAMRTLAAQDAIAVADANRTNPRAGEPEIRQSKQLQQQQALLTQQQDMLARLREQQLALVSQLDGGAEVDDDDFGPSGSGAGGSMALGGGHGGGVDGAQVGGVGLNNTMTSLRRRGRVLIREYLVALTPQQHAELQARKQTLYANHSQSLPFAVHSYMRKRTGKPAYSTLDRKKAYRSLETHESPFLAASGPFVDSSWIERYFRKEDPSKWVGREGRGFRPASNPHAAVFEPEREGMLPLFAESYVE